MFVFLNRKKKKNNQVQAGFSVSGLNFFMFTARWQYSNSTSVS